MAEASDDLTRRLAFLAEIDRLKTVLRQSRIADRSRRENSAEHSWHLAMFAIVLAPHAEGVDMLHVVKLLLVHDIVEIDAGDVPFHQAVKDHERIAAAEAAAAERIFGLLPEAQGRELHDLWREFEAAGTKEARFAKALDRLQPVFLNTLTDGGTWNDFEVSEEQVMARCGPPIERGSPELWQAAAGLIRKLFARRRAEGAEG